MNYYSHHLGDYAEATSHLTFVEDAAYSRLLRKYYAHEKPLIGDVQAVQRLCGARTKEEKQAVETVLAEFFVFTDNCWHHKRCDEEIARFRDKQMKAKASADARWSAQRAQCQTDTEAMRSHSEGNAHHTPIAKSQEPNIEPGFKHTDVDTPCELSEGEKFVRVSLPEEKKSPGITQATAAGKCCAVLMNHGIVGCNPSHPTLLELINAGASEPEFAAAARQAKERKKANFSYVLGIVRRQREEAAAMVTGLYKGRMPNAQELLEESNRTLTRGWRPPELREVAHAN